MEIRRQKEVVEAFHYDMRLPNQEVETDLKVGFSPLKETIENYPKEHSIVGARLEFRLVFDTYVLSGSVSRSIISSIGKLKVKMMSHKKKWTS